MGFEDEDFELDDDELEVDDEVESDEDDIEWSEDEDEDESEDDPYAWLKEAGEDNVKKTWNQYTQTREEVLEQKRMAEERARELEPIARLRDEILADPGLVKVIDEYMQSGRPAEREVHDLKGQLNSLQMQMATDREFEELQSWIRKEDLDPVSKEEVLQFAIENRVGSLKAAYKAMNYEKGKEKAVDKLTKDIKKSKGAKLPKSKRADRPTKTPSIEDIAKMSDEEFEKNYDSILKKYKK